jgi:hypothetical protein
LVSAFFIIFVVLRRKKMDKNVYQEEEMKDLKRNKDSQSNKLLGFFFELNN